jgi:hypothetical protein
MVSHLIADICKPLHRFARFRRVSQKAVFGYAAPSACPRSAILSIASDFLRISALPVPIFARFRKKEHDSRLLNQSTVFQPTDPDKATDSA